MLTLTEDPHPFIAREKRGRAFCGKITSDECLLLNNACALFVKLIS